MNWVRLIPKFIRPLIGNITWLFAPTKVKHMAELHYWQSRWEQEGRVFRNDFYEKLMLGIANEKDASFLRDKIVADFGCGPRGSLCWASPARIRIGIDVLAEQYARFFNIASHNMYYLCSTEQYIPLPSNYVDVLYTVNAMDHVADFESMCLELLRILAPGGELIASFNLDEPATFCEPQTMTEEKLKRGLLGSLEVTSYRLAPSGPNGDFYRYFFDSSDMPQILNPDIFGFEARNAANRTLKQSAYVSAGN
ncbi:MAG TPA: methyltransferase domain-containing protein [Thermodesulfobacteriota bacterium]|nr:methyltransferase domain-containing protein [Thermodesulfobacteriota bacterium]